MAQKKPAECQLVSLSASLAVGKHRQQLQVITGGTIEMMLALMLQHHSGCERATKTNTAIE